jgi:hypothetical protein
MSDTQIPRGQLGATRPSKQLVATVGDAQISIEDGKLLIWRNGGTTSGTPEEWIEWSRRATLMTRVGDVSIIADSRRGTVYMARDGVTVSATPQKWLEWAQRCSPRDSRERLADWQREVANGNTRLSYAEWALHQEEGQEGEG